MLAGPLPSSVLVVCCFLYAPFSFLFNKHAASIEHAIAYCVMLFIAVVMHGDDGVREFRREQHICCVLSYTVYTYANFDPCTL